MISRRNFLTITVLMFVLLFLFLFSSAYKDSLNTYDTNIYSGTKTQLHIDNIFQKDKAFTVGEEPAKGFVAYVGENQDQEKVIRQWCRYTRRNLMTAAECADFKYGKEKPYLICLEGKNIDVGDIPSMQEWVKDGIHLVFCGTPSIRVLMRKEIKELMGVRNIREESVTLEGIVLHEGFLLGGGYTYTIRDEATKKLQDLNLVTSWFEMNSGTKAYMTGLLDEKIYGETQNEYLPAIVWRNSIDNTKIFVVNGNYMDSVTGIGFLCAMTNEIESYSLYPVINAQNMVVVNYPSFTPENEDAMFQLYSRDSYRVLREVVWPGLTAVLTNTDSKMSCMLTTKMDYNEKASPEKEDLIFFMKLLREQEAEAGISCDQTSNVGVEGKLSVDHDFLALNLPAYKFLTAYVAENDPEQMRALLKEQGFSDVRTYLKDFEDTGELVYLTKDGDVVLTTINSGDSHKYSEDIRERAIETALGFSVVTEDLQHIIYPQDANDQWQNVYKDFARYTDTFYDAFDAFEELTLSDSGSRAKIFLSTIYEQSRNGNVITLKSNYDTGCFVLRIHDEEINKIEGGEFKKIEDDAWLISLEKKEVKITLKKEENRKK